MSKYISEKMPIELALGFKNLIKQLSFQDGYNEEYMKLNNNTTVIEDDSCIIGEEYSAYIYFNNINDTIKNTEEKNPYFETYFNVLNDRFVLKQSKGEIKNLPNMVDKLFIKKLENKEYFLTEYFQKNNNEIIIWFGVAFLSLDEKMLNMIMGNEFVYHEIQNYGENYYQFLITNFLNLAYLSTGYSPTKLVYFMKNLNNFPNLIKIIELRLNDEKNKIILNQFLDLLQLEEIIY